MNLTKWKKQLRSYGGTMASRGEEIVGMLDENNDWFIYGRNNGLIVTSPRRQNPTNKAFYFYASFTDKGYALAKDMAAKTEKSLW